MSKSIRQTRLTHLAAYGIAEAKRSLRQIKLMFIFNINGYVRYKLSTHQFNDNAPEGTYSFHCAKIIQDDRLSTK